MQIQTVQTQKIYRNIVEQIINLITDGSLKCGDKLPPERTLAEMLNVSRASLREAFSAMEIIGIIDIRPGEGSFVSDLKIQPFLSLIVPLLLKGGDVATDLLQFRKMIEISGIMIIVNDVKPSEEKLMGLKEILDKMEDALSDSDASAKLDVCFHKCLFSMSDNTVLINVLDCISFVLEKTVSFNRNNALSQKHKAEVLFEQHKAIYEAVAMGDAGLAASRMGSHLDFVKKVTLTDE